jgi:hypothetical protein
MISHASVRRLRLIVFAAMAGACCLGPPNAAQAVELWYDGFDLGQYTAGASIAGQSGGAGTFFTGPWVQPGGDDQLVLGSSLAKPGQLDPSIGGSLGDNDAPACCVTGRVARMMTQPWSGRTPPEGTFYIGFLANYGQVVGGAVGDVHHRTLEMWEGGFDDVPNRNLMLGYSTFAGLGSQMALMVKDSTSATTVTKQLNEHLEFVDDGDTHCLVMKFELSNTAGADRVSVFLDPMGMVEPGTPSAQISGADFAGGGMDLLLDSMGGIVQFSFFGGNLDVAARIDEVRVGTEFADVACMIPEPATLSLAGFCALGMLTVARRKVA